MLEHFAVHLLNVVTNNGSYHMLSSLCHVYQVLRTALKAPLPSLRALFPRWWLAPPVGLVHSLHFHTSVPQHLVLCSDFKNVKPDSVLNVLTLKAILRVSTDLDGR